MTLEQLKAAVAHIKRHDVGTIYLFGERQYIWMKGRGWVKPGPYKEAMRKKPKGKKPKPPRY